MGMVDEVLGPIDVAHTYHRPDKKLSSVYFYRNELQPGAIMCHQISVNVLCYFRCFTFIRCRP